MIFGTYSQDEDYLWKKFKAPELDPSTGIDQDTAAKEIVRFAELDAPPPIIKARAFEFLTESLQIDDGHGTVVVRKTVAARIGHIKPVAVDHKFIGLVAHGAGVRYFQPVNIHLRHIS